MARRGGIATAIDVLRWAAVAERLGELGVHDRGDMELEGPSGERGPSGLLNERALGRLVVVTREKVKAAGDPCIMRAMRIPVRLTTSEPNSA
jgi:hypothetical protein